MAENLTRSHKLVEELSSSGWFANPAGREGYKVIVLEKVGDGGTRFYCSLDPGKTLGLSERVLGRYRALSVDIRHARSFPVEGEFAVRERGRKIKLRVKVRYYVTNARTVAMGTVDPLGELRDKVVAMLNRELAQCSESKTTPGLVERIIRNIGPVPHLGLTVEDADILEFTSDSQYTQRVVEEEGLRHEISIGELRESAELASQSRRHEAGLRQKQDVYAAINLSNINVFLHEHPELADKIFSTFAQRDQHLLESRLGAIAPAINAYINQQVEDDLPVDSDHIVNMLSAATTPSATQPQNSVGGGKIVWGESAESNSPSKRISFESEASNDEETHTKHKPDPRIVFDE